MADQSGTPQDILLKIDLQGRDQLTGARSDAQALNKELGNAGKTNLDEPTKSLRQQLREAIVEAQKLATSGQQNTAEFKKAATQVATIKEQIKDLNRTFQAFDPSNKFRVFANTAQSGAKIVQGYAGAMAFLGVKSKDAEETIAKLQGIMLFTDALGSLHDLRENYKDLLQLLGLNTTAAKQLSTAVASTDVAQTVGGATEATTNTAGAGASDANAGATNELTTANTAATTSQTELNDAETANTDILAANTDVVAAATEARLANNDAILAGAAGLETATVANEGLVVAEEAGTVASFTLGAALKAIGIGLIISAIAYLISNWQSLKKSVEDLFPGLKTAGGLFNTIKEVAFGVGNVLLQFVITPIKILIDVIKGDFAGAVADFKKGIDVIGNFKAGEAYEAANIAADAAKKRIQLEIEANERIIKERKALGKDVSELEAANNKLKISQLDKDKLGDEDYEKQKLDLISEGTVAYNAELKKRQDKYNELLKTDLQKTAENEKENAKIVQAGSEGERTIALSDNDYKYKLELQLLEKRKAANKNYAKDYADLVAAKKIEETKINKKYDDIITEYKKGADEAYLDDYEKKAIEINKKAEEALKAATTGVQKAQVLQTKAFLLNSNQEQSIADKASQDAQNKLTYVEDANEAKEGDTPQQAITKIDALEEARLNALNASYALEKAQHAGQDKALEKLAADHEKKLTAITNESAKARKDIAKAEAESRIAMFDAISAGASSAADILGETTVAGKALAIAAATISTYTAIAKTLSAYSDIPIPGYAIANAIAIGIAGIATVKKIIDVQVPAKSAGGGGGANAPVINTTVLQQANAGTQQVVGAVNQQNQQPQNIKAYIVNKDLNKQASQQQYYNSQSTY